MRMLVAPESGYIDASTASAREHRAPYTVTTGRAHDLLHHGVSSRAAVLANGDGAFIHWDGHDAWMHDVCSPASLGST